MQEPAVAKAHVVKGGEGGVCGLVVLLPEIDLVEVACDVTLNHLDEEIVLVVEDGQDLVADLTAGSRDIGGDAVVVGRDLYCAFMVDDDEAPDGITELWREAEEKALGLLVIMLAKKLLLCLANEPALTSSFAVRFFAARLLAVRWGGMILSRRYIVLCQDSNVVRWRYACVY